MFRKRCFVVMPFDDEFDDVFADIQTVLAGQQVDCRRGDHHKRPGAVMEQIEQDIRSSDLVIADLSGVNPNVFYEVGIAHGSCGTTSRTILLTRSSEHVPYDLRSQRYLTYRAGSAGRAAFRQELAEWVRNALESIPEDEGAIVDAVARTQRIVEAGRRILEEWETGRNQGPRMVRTIAGLASLAISEHEQTREPPAASGQEELYRNLLQLERDTLLELLARGAEFRMILRPPEKWEPKRGYVRLALRLRRMIALLEGRSDSRDPRRQELDRLVRERCAVVIVTVSESNTLILGDQIAFEVFRRGSERGFDGTYWTSRRRQVADLTAAFDQKFSQAGGQTGGVISSGPIDHVPAIARLREAYKKYKQSVGDEWDESVFDGLP